MSRILDPSGGDGPNKGDEVGTSEQSLEAGFGQELLEDEGGGDQPQAAPEEINPVQHSE